MIKSFIRRNEALETTERDCFTTPQIDHHIKWLDKTGASEKDKELALKRKEWITTKEIYDELGD